LNNPFTQNVTENLKVSANIEPVRDFKITLEAQQTRRANYAELFRFNEDTGLPETQNPVRNGSFSISTISFMTAFKKDNALNENPNFTTFEQNRDIILQRLRAINPAFDPNAPENGDYALNSQDVLIPAFLAAYTGADAGTIGLSPFPRTPLPNWRIDYAGLSKLPFFSDIFSSVTLTHAYQSSYGVNNYTSSLQYGEAFVNISTDERNYVIPNLTNEAGDFLSVYVVSQVVLSERFSPLIGINIRTKSNLSLRLDYNKERDLSLNLSNAQLAEIRNESITFSVGFTKSKMKLPIKSKGKFIILDNDVDLRLDMTIRDTRTVQRQLDDVSTVTAGNLNFQLRPVISYVVNKQLNLQFYFEKNINDPRVSSSFRRTTTAGGIQLRYNLAL
jgi:cell surface protein SprA